MRWYRAPPLPQAAPAARQMSRSVLPSAPARRPRGASPGCALRVWGHIGARDRCLRSTLSLGDLSESKSLERNRLRNLARRAMLQLKKIAREKLDSELREQARRG